MLVTKIKQEESWKVPAQTSVVFSIKNPYGEQEKKNLVQAKRETTTNVKGDNIVGASATVVC